MRADTVVQARIDPDIKARAPKRENLLPLPWGERAGVRGNKQTEPRPSKPSLCQSLLTQGVPSRSKRRLRRFFRDNSHGRLVLSKAVYTGRNIRRTEKYNTVRQERPLP